MEHKTTDAELLLLGLIAEMPRHGYELEQVIEQRGMREWTQIGFSSIYFVLGKLEKAGLIAARAPESAKSRKIFTLTATGEETLRTQTVEALREVRPRPSSVLLGMAHWPVLDRDTALGALADRARAVGAEIERLAAIQYDQQPLPDFVNALFDYSLGQLRAELKWVEETLAYMEARPWPK
ncbi:PadR family transcriptional regulator [Cucumibacter marinus]|uniref:PadR family transcriptional regulator n=1 Tax=Cucumibacter marinus TaxID=1121252 RepID=UPI000420EBE1|nr:PadR family transcriptional regulator [Cucumibacter marinus]